MSGNIAAHFSRNPNHFLGLFGENLTVDPGARTDVNHNIHSAEKLIAG
jgi:hypothetical protein